LVARSRRPHRSPTRIAERHEDAIVALRKELTDAGFDAGAATIEYHLARRQTDVPSVSTIWRVLKARGFVTPQPHKRPRSSYVRFVAELPNECWQADVTHVRLADGGFLEILNVIDDHSRLCVESRAFVTTRSPDVVRALHRAGQRFGYPEALLTDNGAIFTASPRGNDVGAMEPELLALGIASRHSRPYHPQTCGKVERFHQTLKRYLAKQDPALTKRQLQAQLDSFVAYYNELRPHRGLERRTPAEAFAARERAYPCGPKIDCAGYRVRHDRIDKKGVVTLRYQGRLHHIGVGAAYKGWRVVMLVAGRDIRILGLDGSQLRRLTLDPTHDYQAMP
jgi:transposase InsO family protein